MRDEVIIFVNGRRHAVRGPAVFAPLTDFLRRDLGLTGTKVVCAEGDCGSCSVMLGRARGDRIAYEPVCACIQYLLQLDGAHVVTVEGLRDGGELNPVQSAMAACHGAQCGYCTPGFVVAMQALCEAGKIGDAHAVRRGLTGNLCRCTGYEPILRAAAETQIDRVRRVDELYPSAGLLDEMRRASSEPVLVGAGEKVAFKPVTLEQAVEFRAANPGCAIIAGGTDLGVMMNKGTRRPVRFMSTGAIAGFDELSLRDGALIVGGGTNLSALCSALAEHLPEFGDFMEWFGSPLIRNAGTLAGNLANASPIGDTLPPLFVLEALIELAGPGGTRAVNINDFYTGYRQTVMREDELIRRVIIPLPRADEVFKLHKASKRKDLDISTFSAAVWMRLRDGVIVDARLAYGGVGPTVIRLRRTEDALRGQRFSDETMSAVAEIVAGEISPISDVRGSKEYRLLLGTNVLRRVVAEMLQADSNGNGRD